MPEACYVRLMEEDLAFVSEYSKEQNLPKSTVIKNLLHKTIQRLKLNIALERYKNNELSIRECAALSNLSYRGFFNELCKRGLIGASTKEEEEEMLRNTLE